MSAKIKIGQKFRVKKNADPKCKSFLECGYNDFYVDFVKKQKFLIRIPCPPNVGDDLDQPENIWYYNEKAGGKCFLKPDVVEPFEPKTHNHPLTKMFV